MGKLFSYRDRPVHLGPFPLENLARCTTMPAAPGLPPCQPLSFDDPNPLSLSHAMGRFMAMFDTVRDGAVGHGAADIPADPVARAQHLKAAGYYYDAAMMGVAKIQPDDWLQTPFRNPAIDGIRAELEQGQPKTFAAGIDAIYADILDSARATPGPVPHHTHALVILVDYARDPDPAEAGCDWTHGTQPQRAALLAANTAILLSSYLRMLGYDARAHTASTSDIDLTRLAVTSGLALAQDGQAVNPFVGTRYGLAVVSTTLEIACDMPLKGGDWARARSKRTGHEPRRKPLMTGRPYCHGPHQVERLKRVDTPTTFIDEPRVPRFPKRADFFARALFGDMGPNVQEATKGGMYVLKSPIGACARRALGALLLLQFGEARGPVHPSASDPARNSDNLKGAAHFLSVDIAGTTRVPDWAWYSHDAGGNPIAPRHPNAIAMLLDQGHETMEGASGDDWISVAQSMRAYLRFSLQGGVIAEQVRRMGYSARVHSVLDGEVLQPPLLLLAGLGEVSRIGEVILNPFLGPRLKSGAVTTDMPMTHDKPIDFGLQRFCASCNKCARECPSGAITAGPKLMYNGYEIWKSDAEKCARYRLTNSAGGMCGRCMKTCPWNLEGLLVEEPFRRLAIALPSVAPVITALDDKLGRGSINPVKKWWWDIELDPAQGRYVAAKATNIRGLNRDLKLKAEDQTLAVYPADVMPPPLPVIHPLNREDGIARYRALLTPDEYRNRLARGQTDGLAPGPVPLSGPPPVFPVVLSRRDDLSDDVVRYEFTHPDGADLPAFSAGGHIDVVIAPEYQRQYSLAGDPACRARYVLGVQREAAGRGGSILMNRVFQPGRRVFVSPPRNHFPLDEGAQFSVLLGGGIGITPMLTMAHRLHALGRDFALHYSVRGAACFWPEITAAPWAARAHLYNSADGNRADLNAIIPDWQDNMRLYTCGGVAYMDSVFNAARAKGWPDSAVSREYFTVPEAPPYVNHPFTLRLSSGRMVAVSADQSATDALAAAGINVPMKCKDGICGVCAATHNADTPIEHRDYVLSAKERATRIVLCCSRPAKDGAVLTIDL
ncbi:4Fe-4S double cluster binding domain-containing protein [Roseinatronobacter sp.]